MGRPLATILQLCFKMVLLPTMARQAVLNPCANRDHFLPHNKSSFHSLLQPQRADGAFAMSPVQTQGWDHSADGESILTRSLLWKKLCQAPSICSALLVGVEELGTSSSQAWRTAFDSLPEPQPGFPTRPKASQAAIPLGAREYPPSVLLYL